MDGSLERQLHLQKVEGTVKCCRGSIGKTDDEFRMTRATAASRVDYVEIDDKKRPPEE